MPLNKKDTELLTQIALKEFDRIVDPLVKAFELEVMEKGHSRNVAEAFGKYYKIGLLDGANMDIALPRAKKKLGID